MDGMPYVICGVTPITTTHEIIVAVAKARKKTGRYRMVIRMAAYPEQVRGGPSGLGAGLVVEGRGQCSEDNRTLSYSGYTYHREMD